MQPVTICGWGSPQSGRSDALSAKAAPPGSAALGCQEGTGVCKLSGPACSGGVGGASDQGWSVPEALEAGGGTCLGLATVPRVEGNAHGEAWQRDMGPAPVDALEARTASHRDTGAPSPPENGRKEAPPARKQQRPASSCFVTVTSPSC